MKKHLFPLVFLALGSYVHAQQQDFFALVGKDTPNIVFNDFRAIDGTSGVSGDKIFTADAVARVVSQTSGRIVTEDRNAHNNAQAVNMATLAYASNGDLVYMPMFSSNVYVLDGKTKAITLVENSAARVTSCDINSHFTRMTAGYDGNIYAINNSGTQFLQISNKNGQYKVNDLGVIRDNASNGKNSFTLMETGFGGDMIAGADNTFYVFAASGNVFTVTMKDLQATFIGKISGLPENYSVNGSAVNAKGKVVVASAKGGALYEVDLKTLQATRMPGEENLHIYDLASKYFANDKAEVTVATANIDVYPTRVNEHFINIRANDPSIKGNVTVAVFDLSGKTVMRSSITAKDGRVQEQIYLKNLVTGAYLVNITDDSGKVLLNKKIMITE